MVMFEECLITDIPEVGSWGKERTPESFWAEDLLNSFVNSSVKCARVSTGLNGQQFATNKDAEKHAGAIRALFKRKQFKNIQVMQRKRDLYLSKIKITMVGE